MQTGRPSRTALAAAAHRAAHQLFEQGRIFNDPLAIRILGPRQELTDDPSRRRMRLFIAIRTRFAEDALAHAIEHRGVKQFVVLGAGLDMFAYRNPFDDRLRVFEVDYPATQSWKRERLAEVSIEVPASLTYAPCDFERQTLDEALDGVGFNRAVPSFFTWLGVVPYLSEAAVWVTLGSIARLEGGSSVVFDYGNPPEALSGEARIEHERRAARVESIGEAFVTFFETQALERRLRATGFTQMEDLGPRQIVARYFPGRSEAGTSDHGGHLMLAATS